MKAKWTLFDEDCPRCGHQIEVETISTEPGQAYADEQTRCPNCKLEGYTDVDEWYDEPRLTFGWPDFWDGDEVLENPE